MATRTVRRAGDGVDRLYVSGVDGRRLGWHDLGSGATHLEDSDAGLLVSEAVARYVASRSPLRRRGVGVLVGPRAVGVPVPRGPAAGTRPGGASTGGSYPGGARAGGSRDGSRTGASRAGGSWGGGSWTGGTWTGATWTDGAAGLVGAPDGTEPEDLRERVAGETTARALLQALPATVPARGRWARLVGRDPLAPVNRAHHQQVLAERRVGRLLAGSGRRWQALHCVPVAAGQSAHHLLLGAGGVVLVRTCTHPGEVVSVVGEAVLAGGQPSSVLLEARSQAAVVAEQLGCSRGARVHALVVVVGARRLDVVAGVPRGTTVLREEDLLRWLRDRPAVLSTVDVERLLDAAARPGTWPGHAAEVTAEVGVGTGVGVGTEVGVGTAAEVGTAAAARPGDLVARARRGRRRQERLRLDDWSAAVAAAAHARLVGRLALLVGACTAVPALAASVVGGA